MTKVEMLKKEWLDAWIAAGDDAWIAAGDDAEEAHSKWQEALKNNK